MITQAKEQYVSPETEVIPVSTESTILQLSGGKYPGFTPEGGEHGEHHPAVERRQVSRLYPGGCVARIVKPEKEKER